MCHTPAKHMRRLLFLALLLSASSACSACSGSKGRIQHVQSARVHAANGGVRQAQEFAAAVDGAFKAGDYKKKAKAGVIDAGEAMQAIDRVLPMAGVDGPTLVAWRAVLLLDVGRTNDAFSEYNRSFAMGPNELAGTALIDHYSQANRPDLAGEVCAKTVPALRTTDAKLEMIARCRKRMNAISPEGEMAWMSPELVDWYQTENARRLGAAVEADNARAERQRQEQRVVRGMEQCSASCKERGLYCQNNCRHDPLCDQRCVEINRACLDRCESKAYDSLDR
ncbi:hypothetical protein [Labilithrix luteola]|nr:hypothetical protein [Labilithrix luteola]